MDVLRTNRSNHSIQDLATTRQLSHPQSMPFWFVSCDSFNLHEKCLESCCHYTPLGLSSFCGFPTRTTVFTGLLPFDSVPRTSFMMPLDSLIKDNHKFFVSVIVPLGQSGPATSYNGHPEPAPSNRITECGDKLSNLFLHFELREKV